MHRMNEKGESLRDRSSFHLLFLFFFFHVPRTHSVWLRISIERRWWMAIGIKLCGAPVLMLRNTHIWKLGKFDLRSVAPSSAYTFHVWSNAASQIAAAVVAKRFIWKSSRFLALIATGCYIDRNTWNISFLRQNVKLMPTTEAKLLILMAVISTFIRKLSDYASRNPRCLFRLVDLDSYYVLSVSLDRERRSLPRNKILIKTNGTRTTWLRPPSCKEKTTRNSVRKELVPLYSPGLLFHPHRNSVPFAGREP